MKTQIRGKAKEIEGILGDSCLKLLFRKCVVLMFVRCERVGFWVDVFQMWEKEKVGLVGGKR